MTDSFGLGTLLHYNTSNSPCIPYLVIGEDMLWRARMSALESGTSKLSYGAGGWHEPRAECIVMEHWWSG